MISYWLLRYENPYQTTATEQYNTNHADITQRNNATLHGSDSIQRTKQHRSETAAMLNNIKQVRQPDRKTQLRSGNPTEQYNIDQASKQNNTTQIRQPNRTTQHRSGSPTEKYNTDQAAKQNNATQIRQPNRTTQHRSGSPIEK